MIVQKYFCSQAIIYKIIWDSSKEYYIKFTKCQIYN